MLRGCLHKNSFRPKMSIKLFSVVWNYHILILKLLHCNSIAVFFLYFFLSKHAIYKPLSLRWLLLKFWIVINFLILWMKNNILWVKNYLLKIMEDFAEGILHIRVEHVKLFLVKHNSVFGAGYYKRKNDIFCLTEVLYLISFLKKSWRKKAFE